MPEKAENSKKETVLRESWRQKKQTGDKLIVENVNLKKRAVPSIYRLFAISGMGFEDNPLNLNLK